MWQAYVKPWTSTQGLRHLTGDAKPRHVVSQVHLLSCPPSSMTDSSTCTSIENVNQAICAGRNDPPESPNDLFARLVASPFAPTHLFIETAVRDSAGAGSSPANRFEFDPGSPTTRVRSGAMAWSSGFGMSVKLVYRLPFTEAVLQYIDENNADETCVLKWTEKSGFEEFESEGAGPLPHHSSLTVSIKTILRMVGKDIEGGCPPLPGLVMGFRALVRAVPRFQPAVTWLGTSVVMRSGRVSQKDLLSVLVTCHTGPPPDFLSGCWSGKIPIVEGPAIPFRDVEWSASQPCNNHLTIRFKTGSSVVSISINNTDTELTVIKGDCALMYTSEENGVESTFPTDMDTAASPMDVAIGKGVISAFEEHPTKLDPVAHLIRFRTACRLVWAATSDKLAESSRVA